MALFFLLFLQIVPIPELPDPDAPVVVGGEIVGPYILRQDSGQTTKVVLKNGLTVLVRENNAVALTSIATHVRAGYFDEPDGVSGISHLIENMLFKGTQRRAVGQIARQTRALGGVLNAHTSYDRTVYSTVVPSENAVAAMEIQADALWNPLFDSEALAREIEVVLQENSRKLDNPAAVAIEGLYGTAFAEHRMRRSRMGNAEGLRTLTQDDLTAFYGQYYQPSNIILSVVGRFEREEMLAEIVRLYGDAPDRPVQREHGPSEPPQSAFRYNWERGPIEQAQVVLGFHVPDRLSDDAYVAEVLSAILTTGRASRMNRFLRDEMGLIQSATSSVASFYGVGYLHLRLVTTTPVDAELGALEEIRRIQRFGVTQEELSRARILIAQDHYHRLETVGSLAKELANQEALGGWDRMDRYVDGILGVNRSDVQRFAREYLVTENLSVFEYLPRADTRSFSSDDFAANVLDRVPVEIVARRFDELPVLASVARPNTEVVLDMVRPPVRSQVLRGPDVYLIEDHRLPLVSFGIFYPGGRLYESAENSGITDLMLRAALRGTLRYNSADVSRRLENAGARIEVVNEPDFFGYLINGVSGQIEDALDVIMQVLQEPTFPEAAVEQERRLQVARLRDLREDNLRYPIQLFMESIFDGHSYARSRFGTELTLAGFTPDALSDWHDENMRRLVPLIVLVGDTNGTALVASIAQTLTNEDLSERNISRLPPPALDLERQERFESSDRKQSAMVYGMLGPRLPDVDRLPLTVIENVLSGLGGRLFESIREEQGLAYTVRVFDDFLNRSGAFFAYTAFSPEDEEQVREALEEEFGRLVLDGITDEEMEHAVNYSIGTHEISLESRSGRSLAYARAVISGEDISVITGFPDALRGISRDRVENAARRYLSPSFATVVVVRGQTQ